MQDDDNLFFSQNSNQRFENPDLKIIEDSFVYGVSATHILSTQTLGSVNGGLSQVEEGRKEVTSHTVQSGDTIESIAEQFNISSSTLLWANNLSKNATLKVGQSLVILPISGVMHVIKSGNTVSELARTYKSKTEDIIAFNNLVNEGDVFVGDILIIPGGVMPPKGLPSNGQVPLPDSFFIYPTEGSITQGLHYYNAVDIANTCGTPVYAAAAGTVQRARYGWNHGGGNNITILHSGGVATYYGHLMSIFVKSGDKVTVGDRIALVGGGPGMSGAGISTGCHLHFDVIGAKNPFAKYFKGALLKYK